MKLHLEVDGKVLKFEMRSSWFRASCKLIAAGIYASTAAKLATVCGMPGLLTVAGATLLIGAGYVIEKV